MSANRVREIFMELVANVPPEQWEGRLAELAGGDAGLRDKVAALLAAHRQADSFLEQPAPQLGATADEVRAPASPDEPRAIGLTAADGPGVLLAGRYKLLQAIGEGGMGTVWMAQQTEPVKRLVAVKLIKPGMDSKVVLARFEAERQALALMDHPNIAKVLDGGAAPDGRPFFVMELVKGVPMTRYCDEHRLTPRQRLELFVPVCQAVQHAHQKGVIHRDLKPSNILVAPYDGRPVPKVIDFGIAKAAGQPLTEKTLFTGFGAVVGTPEYMSPEQAELNNQDIDTRSDVYALGVLLYELLTGTTPLTRKRVKEGALLEVLRLVREEEPPRPSTRLSTTAELPAIAASRGLEPRTLSGVVRGELDWIVMKCLEKNRDLRYETANSLTLDLQRYLRDEPVQACPPSAAYRLQKLVRRYRRALAMAGVVLAGLLLAVLGLAISTLLTWQAKGKIELTLAQERQSLYHQRIALADRELGANNVARALELLTLCPLELRRWEWHYLNRSRGRPAAVFAHPYPVSGKAALGPDGTKLATAGSNGEVTVWDLTTGARRLIKAHDIGWMVAFSPDGRAVASASERVGAGPERGEVRFWGPDTGNEVLPAWKLGDRYVNHMAFSPDARRLAVTTYVSGQKEDAIEIREFPSGRVLLSLPNDETGPQALAFSPDGQFLAAAGGNRTVRVWESHTGRMVHEFREPRPGPNPCWCVAFSPDGRRLAAGYGHQSRKEPGGVRVWDVATWQEAGSLVGDVALSVAFSADGRLASGGVDGSVRVWDVERGQELLTLRGHTSFVTSLAFTPNGHQLVSSSDDGLVRVWDATPLRQDANPGDELLTLTDHTDCVNTLAFHPALPLLATGGSDGTLRLWGTRAGFAPGKVVRPGPGTVDALAFDPSGERLAVTDLGGGLCGILDAGTMELRVKLEKLEDETPHRLAFSPDGKLLAGCDFETLLVWDAGTGAVRHRLNGHRGRIFGLVFSQGPSGPLLVSVCTSGDVRVWDPATGEGVKLLQHPGAMAVAFSPDGSRMATAGWDRVVRVWDTTSWKVVEESRDPTGGPNTVAFSPDGKRLAWGGTDATVKVWELGTSTVTTLRGHDNWVWSVAFSPDGDVLASASRDGTVKIWQTPSLAKK
jgi:WD40 repeat protein